MERKLYKDIRDTGHYLDLKRNGALKLLEETISTFFSCQVTTFAKPSTQIKSRYGIDILTNQRRGVYPVDEANIIIVGRILEKGSSVMIASIAFLLSRPYINTSIKFINYFERALTHELTENYYNYSEKGTLILGDELAKYSIANYISKKGYDFRQVRHLIEYMFKLRTTSFEGSFFSTGLILTRSHHEFERRKETYNRYGSTYSLVNSFSIKSTNIINKRIWFLVDGKRVFFLGNKDLRFNQIFVIDTNYSNDSYLDSHSLALSLKGGDSVFKIENEKLLTINTPGGYEFAFFENQWRFRDFNQLKRIFSDYFLDNVGLIDSFIFYLLNCSKSQNSTIIWLPEDFERIDEIINPNTKNAFVVDEIKLDDKRFINHIIRSLSSDGATIINKQGVIKYFGVIVDIGKAKVNGIKGTGESAASVLCSNGISIKISQDGLIKIYKDQKDNPIIF